MLCLCLDTYVTKRLPLAGPMNVSYDAEVYTATESQREVELYIVVTNPSAGGALRPFTTLTMALQVIVFNNVYCNTFLINSSGANVWNAVPAKSKGYSAWLKSISYSISYSIFGGNRSSIRFLPGKIVLLYTRFLLLFH